MWYQRPSQSAAAELACLESLSRTGSWLILAASACRSSFGQWLQRSSSFTPPWRMQFDRDVSLSWCHSGRGGRPQDTTGVYGIARGPRDKRAEAQRAARPGWHRVESSCSDHRELLRSIPELATMPMNSHPAPRRSAIFAHSIGWDWRGGPPPPVVDVLTCRRRVPLQ